MNYAVGPRLHIDGYDGRAKIVVDRKITCELLVDGKALSPCVGK